MGVSGLGREGADTPTRDVNAANAVKFRTAPQIAQRAADLVGGDRDREHGKKKQNFDNIAAMWNGYLGIRRDKAAPLDAVDVGHMMVAMKIARTQSGALNVDDYVDAAGYAACAGEVAIGLAPPADSARPVGKSPLLAMPYGGDRGDETPEKPKFKVGDRVRCACSGCRTMRHPMRGVVYEIADPWLRIKSEDAGYVRAAIAIQYAELAP